MSVGETGVHKLTPVRKNVKVLAHMCTHMLEERICLHVNKKIVHTEIHTETCPWTGEMNDVRI